MFVGFLLIVFVGLPCALACWCAILRVAARSYAYLGATLAVLLAGAALCWFNAGNNSHASPGDHISSIPGMVMSWLLLCVAAGLVLGALLRLGWRGLGYENPTAAPRGPSPAWDLIGFSVFSLIAVVVSTS